MRLRYAYLAVLIVVCAAPAYAGPVTVNTWYEFAGAGNGLQATGCDPADPAGPFCIESSGTPTTLADAPAWTFTVGASGASFTVTDAFEAGDVFRLFDFGASIGLTSGFVTGTDCGDDPVPCLANAGMSHGVFALGAGNHSITIVTTEGDFGAAYFLLQGDVAGPTPPSAVPEPATLGLVGIGVASAIRRRARREARQ